MTDGLALRRAVQEDLFGDKDLNRPYRLAICGGRNFTDQEYVDAALDEVVRERPIIIVATGDARGADACARVWAAKRGHELTRAFVADWDRFGKSAGMRRNIELLQTFKPDVLVAFEGGRGTQGMIAQARARNIAVIIAGGNDEDLLRFHRHAKTRKSVSGKNDLRATEP